MSFMIGNILSIPTAANEKAINASWMIMRGVRNVGIIVLSSFCPGWNDLSINAVQLGLLVGIVLGQVSLAPSSPVLYFSVSFPLRLLVAPLSPQVREYSVFFLISFEFRGLLVLFLTLLWPPSEFVPPSEIGTGGIICFLPCLLWVLRSTGG